MSSTKKNLLYNFLYQLLIMIQPLVLSPYLSRVLGAEGLGIYSYTHSVSYYFVLFAMLGLNNYGNRSISMIREDKNKLSQTFWSIYSLQFISAISMFVIYIMYITFFVNENKLIFIIQSVYVFSSLLDINWFFFGIEKFKLTVTRNTIVKLSTLFLVFLVVNNENDLWLYSLIMTASFLLSQSLLWPFLKEHVHFYKPSKKELMIHLIPNLTLFVPVIAISLYTEMDKIMLGLISGMSEVGMYTNAMRIIILPSTIIAAINVVMLPKMSNLFSKGEKIKSQIYIDKSVKLVSFFAIAFAFGIAAISKDFAPFFFGSEFYKVGYLMMILSPMILANSLAGVIRNQYLIPTGKNKEYIISVFLGAIMNVVINLFLIVPFGSFGAAVGTVFAEFTVAIYQTFQVRKDLPIKKYLKNLIPIIISGILMFITVKLISFYLANLNSPTLLVLEILSGAIVYILACTVILLKSNPKIMKNKYK